MARRLRIEHPGAEYHVTSRGYERRVIFLEDKDWKVTGNYQVIREVMSHVKTGHFAPVTVATREGNTSCRNPDNILTTSCSDYGGYLVLTFQPEAY